MLYLAARDADKYCLYLIKSKEELNVRGAGEWILDSHQQQSLLGAVLKTQ